MASDEDLGQAQGQDAGKKSDPVPQCDVENDPEPDPEALRAGRIGECRPRGYTNFMPPECDCDVIFLL